MANNIVIEKNNINIKSKIYDYFTITKPRVMLLSIFTAYTGAVIAASSIMSFNIFLVMISVAIGAGSAGAFNMALEDNTDSMMDRTKNRPVAAKTIKKQDAIFFGAFLMFVSLFIMLFVSFYAFCLLLFNILFYSVFYTLYLKKHTVHNIVIGGIAGSMPPVISYVAITNQMDIICGLLFLIIFFWTPAHFWALSICFKSDYKNAKIPVMPNVMGDDYTKMNIIVYSILTCISIIAFLFVYNLSFLCSLILIAYGILFVKKSFDLFLKPDYNPMMFFKFSVIFLFVIFLAITTDVAVFLH